MFEEFINTFNKELNNEIAAYDRQHDANSYEAKWTSARHTRKDVIKILPANELTPSLSWVLLQHSTSV